MKKSAEKTAPFHYWQCGLDYVWLTNGVAWERNEYGDFFSIKDVEGLHDLIAHELVTSPARLRGQELRFLRSILGMSQAALGKQFGVTRDAIAKNEASPDKLLPPKVDRLLRLVFLVHKRDPNAFCEMRDLLEDIAEDEYQREISFSHKPTGWNIGSGKAA